MSSLCPMAKRDSTAAFPSSASVEYKKYDCCSYLDLLFDNATGTLIRNCPDGRTKMAVSTPPLWTSLLVLDTKPVNTSSFLETWVHLRPGNIGSGYLDFDKTQLRNSTVVERNSEPVFEFLTIFCPTIKNFAVNQKWEKKINLPAVFLNRKTNRIGGVKLKSS